MICALLINEEYGHPHRPHSRHCQRITTRQVLKAMLVCRHFMATAGRSSHVSITILLQGKTILIGRIFEDTLYFLKGAVIVRLESPSAVCQRVI